MKIYLGADHQGFHMKEDMEKYLLKQGYGVEDVGDKVLDKDDDFPEFAHRAVIRVLASETSNAKAILICGGGQGMAMAANRFKGIRASVIWDAFEAKMTRNDNDSNVLCLPSRILENDAKEWQDIVETWLKTPFANAQRYKRRNRQIDELI